MGKLFIPFILLILACSDDDDNLSQVGDYHEGGVVFYVTQSPTDLDGDGTLDKGLVCAVEDQGFQELTVQQ